MTWTPFTASDLTFGTAQPMGSYGGPGIATLADQLPGLAPTAPNGFGATSFADKANLALSGLQTLGNLWGAFQSMKLAKKQFKFTKDFAETNLANQIKSYNTQIADRARSRGVMEGQTPGQVSQYISANALARDGAKTAGSSIGNITAAALSNYGRPTPDDQPH